MKFLSRQDFVDICNEAIQKTRANITINNQLDGYIQYHSATKENNYLYRIRMLMAFVGLIVTNHLKFDYELIEHTGLGNCYELATYLLVEIGNAIKAKGAQASLSIVASTSYDHAYLSITIKLQNELAASEWEVDAWDPRIIDISTRPDGSIKNKESLDYGYKCNFINTVDTEALPEYGTPQYDKLLSTLEKPIEGTPSGDATPVHDMLDKHKNLYPNYTLDDAYMSKKIPEKGATEYLQKVSFWQKRKNHTDSSPYKRKSENPRSQYYH
jgi:hypothetical protein